MPDEPSPAPTSNHDIGYVHRVLAAFAFDNTESLWWRVDGEYAPVTFFAQVSDVFWWGTADVEPIAPVDVPLLEQTAADTRRAGAEVWIAELYAARKRGSRPQGAFYEHIPAGLWALFDACGPLRSVEVGNPRPQPPIEEADGAACGATVRTVAHSVDEL
jgi:hypothetical protein